MSLGCFCFHPLNRALPPRLRIQRQNPTRLSRPSPAPFAAGFVLPGDAQDGIFGSFSVPKPRPSLSFWRMLRNPSRDRILFLEIPGCRRCPGAESRWSLDFSLLCPWIIRFHLNPALRSSQAPLSFPKPGLTHCPLNKTHSYHPFPLPTELQDFSASQTSGIKAETWTIN